MKKLLTANTSSGQRRLAQVFSDFCELAALALRNSVDRHGRAEREARYLEVIGNYSPEEARRFAELLARLTLEFQAGFSDVLGRLYMSLELGNGGLGQFFTPYDISLLTAQLSLDDCSERFEEAKRAGRDYLTVHEPACGSGGMVIATAKTLQDAGINYQHSMHVTAQDLDITAVHMTYIQLSLLHVPAAVVHGDTLAAEQRDIWFTPAHIIGGWSSRLTGRIAGGVLPSAVRTEDHVSYIGPQDSDVEGAA